MSPTIALLVTGIFVALVLVVALVLSRRRTRARTAGDGEGITERIAPGDLDADAWGTRATLVQFSTEVCSRCPGTRRLLHRVADTRDGVTVLDVDVTHRPDLARRFTLRASPTVLVLDADGTPRSRFDGPPQPADVERELSLLDA